MKRFKTIVIGTVCAAIILLSFSVIYRVQAAMHSVSWPAVTTYVDGTSVEAGNTVLYSIWYQDSVTSAITQIANKITATSVTFDDSGLVKGRTYNFWAQAFLASGISSDNTVKYAWTFPLVKLSPVGVMTIQ